MAAPGWEPGQKRRRKTACDSGQRLRRSLENDGEDVLGADAPRIVCRLRLEDSDATCTCHPFGAKHTSVSAWWMLRNEEMNIWPPPE